MQLKELKNIMLDKLEGLYDPAESRQLVEWLLSSVTGMSRHELTINNDLMLEEEQVEKLLQGVKQLQEFKPVQYITGTAWFHGMEFQVSPHVLIPRPETEELVKWVVDDYSSVSGLKVLDIGTGSGCIVISLGKILNLPELTAIDISAGVLAVAAANALYHHVEVNFVEIDIFDRISLKDLAGYDIIICNPPYVREQEKRYMKPNVVDHEPHQALFVSDDDPLVYYRAIVHLAEQKLNKTGFVYVEINENLGIETMQLFKNHGFKKIILRKDLQGKDRMLRASF